MTNSAAVSEAINPQPSKDAATACLVKNGSVAPRRLFSPPIHFRTRKLDHFAGETTESNTLSSGTPSLHNQTPSTAATEATPPQHSGDADSGKSCCIPMLQTVHSNDTSTATSTTSLGHPPNGHHGDRISCTRSRFPRRSKTSPRSQHSHLSRPKRSFSFPCLSKHPIHCSLMQEFIPKFVLEVLGGAGAIWGFSEACGLRRPSTVWFWRPMSLSIGFLFLLRFVHQLANACQERISSRNRGSSKNAALSDGAYDLELGIEMTYSMEEDPVLGTSKEYITIVPVSPERPTSQTELTALTGGGMSLSLNTAASAIKSLPTSIERSPHLRSSTQ